MRLRMMSLMLAGLAMPLVVGGCPEEVFDDLEDIDIVIGANEPAQRVRAAVPVVQTVDPRQVALPPALVQQNQSVVINNEVEVVVNLDQQLVPADVPNITLVGFENLTGNDIYVRYLVDGELQGVFVFAGEALLLEYPCLTDIELLSEEDFDPFTQELIAEFDLNVFVGPSEFVCGEAVIFEIDPFGVQVNPEFIDLR